MAARVLLATALYIVIVLLAAPFPGAAGLMLTFPALNGVGLIFAEQHRVAGMARSMLWMPIVNGALCCVYMLALLAFARTNLGGEWMFLTLAWVLAAAGGYAWWKLARDPVIRAGISENRQLLYALVCSAGGGVLTVIVLELAGISRSPAVAPLDIVPWQLASSIWAHKVKIATFVIVLIAFLLVTARRRMSDADRGILTGLPIVPFAGLLSVAGDQTIAMSTRVAVLKGMLTGVWLAPAVAIWFIVGFSRMLQARTPLQSSFSEDSVKFLLLIAAWSFCGAAIAGITYALS
jgi:hypothetical protein